VSRTNRTRRVPHPVLIGHAAEGRPIRQRGVLDGALLAFSNDTPRCLWGVDKEVSQSLWRSQDPDGRGGCLDARELARRSLLEVKEGEPQPARVEREVRKRLNEPPRARRASPAHEQPERTRAEPRHCEDAPAAAAAEWVLSRRVRYGRWTFTREAIKAF
jgi:hypothetical protein